MGRATLAQLKDEFEQLRAEELTAMAAKVESSDLVCTDLRNRVLRLERNRVVQLGKSRSRQSRKR